MPPSAERRAYRLLAALVVVWGANWPIMKAGLAYITPLWFAAGRVWLGALCLFAALAMAGRLRRPGRGDLVVLLAVGVGQVGLTTGLVHWGLMSVEAGRSALLAYTTPLWTVPLAAIFLGERLGARKVLGLALGLAGVAALVGPAVAGRGAATGNALLVLAAMVSAAVIVATRSHGRTVPAIALVPWHLALGGLLLVPAAWLAEGPPALALSAPLVAVLAYNGLAATAFGLWAYVVVMRDLPATSTAVGMLGVPLVGVLASAAWLAEPLSAAKLAGLALIGGGVLAVSLADLGRPR